MKEQNVNREISKLLLKEANRFELCQPWQEDWKDDLDSLMSMYKRGMDFCIKNNYPSLDIIRRYLKGKTEDYNVFIDSQAEVSVYADTVVVLGDSDMVLSIADYGVVSLYVLHNAKVSLVCGANAVVSAETYGDSKLNVGNTSKVTVFQYDNSEVSGKGVKIHKRERDAT